ncbi:MAG: DUF5118 domain-containing protein, partial [Gemmatimonadota bacterium]
MRPLTFSLAAVLLAATACGRSAPAPTPAPAGPRAEAPSGNAARPSVPGGARGAPGRSGGQAGGQQAQPSPKPYDQVITSEAESRPGMFATHRIGEKLYFEIPRDQLDKDELLVVEIAKTVLGSGYGGQAVSNGVYRWQLRNDRVYLRAVSYEAIADSTTPEYRAVQAANTPPIVADFDVAAYGPDS